MTENTKWIAGLSNGETIIEGKGICEAVKGELSSWWKFRAYLKEKNLTINSFGIWAGDRHFNLPSSKPRFRGEVPLGYNCFRYVEQDVLVGEGKKDEYICAEAIYKDFKVQQFVDINDPTKSWINIKLNS